MNIFYPKYYYDSVYDIPFEEFFKNGYKGIIFDIDNTLSEHGKAADKEIIEFFERLYKMGFKTYLMSNNKWDRVSSFANEVGSSYIYDANKPFTKNYRLALSNMGLTQNEVLFVGDQIFTDILGANLTKISSVLVKPIHKQEEFQIKLKRFPEALVLFFYNKTLDYKKKLL